MSDTLEKMNVSETLALLLSEIKQHRVILQDIAKLVEQNQKELQQLQLQQLPFLQPLDTSHNPSPTPSPPHHHKSLPSFTPGTTIFNDLIENISVFVKLSLHDVLRLKKTSYGKVMVELILKCLGQFDSLHQPIKVIDKSRKIFYIKLKECWCCSMDYNVSEFNYFIKQVGLHVFKRCMELQEENADTFSVVDSTRIINTIVKAIDSEKVVKTIRNKCIKSLID
jgi:hypothetical protein